MDYELAKKLKDAGFPFRKARVLSADYFNNNGQSVALGNGTDSIFPRDFELFIPTLSELIEACGESFLYLIRDPGGKWRAWHTGAFPSSKQFDTPEEAVARLWLALQAKG